MAGWSIRIVYKIARPVDSNFGEKFWTKKQNNTYTDCGVICSIKTQTKLKLVQDNEFLKWIVWIDHNQYFGAI